MKEEYKNKIKRFYDESRKLVQYPAKRPLRMIALQKIAAEFELNRTYSEKEVNNKIKDNIRFTDKIGRAHV